MYRDKTRDINSSYIHGPLLFNPMVIDHCTVNCNTVNLIYTDGSTSTWVTKKPITKPL